MGAGVGVGDGIGVAVGVEVSVGVGVGVPNSREDGENEQASMESIKELADTTVNTVCFPFMVPPIPLALPVKRVH